MAQPLITNGVDTHYLPYPQTYQLVLAPRANEFTSYLGTVQRDYPAGQAKYPGTVFLGWEDLSTADIAEVNTAYGAMIDDIDVEWDYYDPDGIQWTATINPEQPNLQSQRYAGVEGTVLFTARLSLAVE